MSKLCTSCGGVMNYDPHFSANVCEKCGQMEKISSNSIKIERTRWVIMRNNRTEIFCGLARDYTFKKVSEIGDTAVKTYSSRKKAISSFENSWYSIDFEYEAVEVRETYEMI